MQRAIVLGLLSAGALGNECKPGFKHKEDLTNRYCRRGNTDADTCNSECCTKDIHTCGGIAGIVCAFDHYMATDAVTLKLAVTDKTKNTVCCKKKATCSSGTVPAGYKAEPAYKDKYCYGDASTCQNNAVCYTPDATKCYGLMKDATGDKLQAQWANAALNPDVNKPAKYYPGQTKKTDGTAWDTHSAYEQSEKWKNTAAGAVPYTACFKAVATCGSSYTCPEGLKKPEAAGTEEAWMQGSATLPTTAFKCNGPASTCPKVCCIADLKKCGGWKIKDAFDWKTNTNFATDLPCDANHYTPSLGTKSVNQGKVTFSNQDVNYQEWAGRSTGEATATCGAKCKTNCCLAKPKCASYTCPAGLKKKAGLTSAAVCSTFSACESECCENDVNKCGGLIASGIQCKYGFYDASVDWDENTAVSVKDRWKNKVANSTTKNDACCSPRAACQLEMNTATPTPAAVVTTTPLVVAALKYSEHRTAIEDASPKASSLLWIGIGAVAGMAVLSFAQGLRSRSHQSEPVEEEDEETLLNTHNLE